MSDHELQPMTRRDGSTSLPARGYSWPPFTEGHTLSLVHGASSPRAVAAKAVEVHEALIDHTPYLAEPVFAPQVSRYLEATAREQLLHAYIMQVCDDKGPQAVPSRVWEQATAATRLASKLADQLGLSPRGHAELKQLAAGADAGMEALERLKADGREVRLRRDAELAQAESEKP